MVYITKIFNEVLLEKALKKFAQIKLYCILELDLVFLLNSSHISAFILFFNEKLFK